MNNLFVISFHSFSDIITNSSTDIFACKTEKTKEMVEQLLLELYNAAEEPLTIEEFRITIATVNLSTIRSFFNSSQDWLSNYEYDSKKKEHITIPIYESVEEFCDINFKGTTPDDEILMIEGASDNSIPYWLQEFITSTFNSFRIHCG